MRRGSISARTDWFKISYFFEKTVTELIEAGICLGEIDDSIQLIVHREKFIFIVQKQIHQLRIKIGAPPLGDDGGSLTSRLTIFVSRALVITSKVSQIATMRASMGNIGAFQPTRVAATVPFFMMAHGDALSHLQYRRLRTGQDGGAAYRMPIN